MVSRRPRPDRTRARAFCVSMESKHGSSLLFCRAFSPKTGSHFSECALTARRSSVNLTMHSAGDPVTPPPDETPPDAPLEIPPGDPPIDHPGDRPVDALRGRHPRPRAGIPRLQLAQIV